VVDPLNRRAVVARVFPQPAIGPFQLETELQRHAQRIGDRQGASLTMPGHETVAQTSRLKVTRRLVEVFFGEYLEPQPGNARLSRFP
jgi:hypothetical protein